MPPEPHETDTIESLEISGQKEPHLPKLGCLVGISDRLPRSVTVEQTFNVDLFDMWIFIFIYTEAIFRGTCKDSTITDIQVWPRDFRA